jgi:hypothetical protein
MKSAPARRKITTGREREGGLGMLEVGVGEPRTLAGVADQNVPVEVGTPRVLVVTVRREKIQTGRSAPDAMVVQRC